MDTDSIIIKNLSLPLPVIANDIWGLPKEQPALITVQLRLRQPFASAASLDQLDSSTIHYGQLAKKIRESYHSVSPVRVAIEAAERAIVALASKADGNFVVAHAELTTTLPKASLNGEGIKIIDNFWYDQCDNTGRRTCEATTIVFDRLRLMTLIGVLEKERAGRQPLIVTLDVKLCCTDATALDKARKAVVQWESMVASVSHFHKLQLQHCQSLLKSRRSRTRHSKRSRHLRTT